MSAVRSMAEAVSTVSTREQRRRHIEAEGGRTQGFGVRGRPPVQLRCFHCGRLLLEASSRNRLNGLTIRCRCKRVTRTPGGPRRFDP